jgi:hypothetical protein
MRSQRALHIGAADQMLATPARYGMETTMSILPDEDPAEALMGVVIAEYEKAIEGGLAPAEALRVLLTFAAEESGRLRSGALASDASQNVACRQRLAGFA